MEDLRKSCLKKRGELSSIERNEKNLLIQNNLVNLLEKLNSVNILIYLEMGSEVEVSSLNKKNRFNLYIPKIVSETEIKVTKYDINNLEKNPLGFYESNCNNFIDETIIDAVIVPGTVFDLNCYRMGYGKGYYDRFLPKLLNAFKIGIAFDIQIVNNLFPKPHDYQLDFIITESKLINKFNNE